MPMAGAPRGSSEVAELPGAEAVLNYWFGPEQGAQDISANRSKFWFMGGPAADAEIQERFGELLAAAAAGGLQDWEAEPRQALALLIVLDQFSRNVYRGTPQAFAQDARAQALAQSLIVAGKDKELRWIERVFVYMPLEHAEDMQLQEQAVSCFSQLAAEVPPALKPTFDSFLDYAKRHRDVIARFGRFPGTNAALGRSSTADEEAYLKATNSVF